jgi:GT2 family glycosyltransferase
VLGPIKVLDLELAEPARDVEDLDRYVGVLALVRLHGAPLGYVRAPVVGGRCPADALRRKALDEHREQILRHLVEDALAAPGGLASVRPGELVDVPHPEPSRPLPSLTVAVCTRDRAADLRRCLGALTGLRYPGIELLVVDNAPSTDATRSLVTREFPSIRYVLEPRAGLDWARNRALIEARGEVLAYTDDDVVVDSGWTAEIGRAFAREPDVAAVTGLVVPFELETEAQQLFELYGGFGKGFRRRLFRLRDTAAERRWIYGTGECGTGANMAFRRAALEALGGFDPALDVGTVTNGGGDLEMFFRLQREGFSLLYEPAAIVRHRHRRDLEGLHAQIASNGTGLYSYFVAAARRYPDQRAGLVRFGLWWFAHWNLRRLAASLAYPHRLPLSLIVAELQGSLRGLFRYRRAIKAAAELASTPGTPKLPTPDRRPRTRGPSAVASQARRVAVRRLDLTSPVEELGNLDTPQVRVFVTAGDIPLGQTDLEVHGGRVAAGRLRSRLANDFGIQLLEPGGGRSPAELWGEAFAGIAARFAPAAGAAAKGEPRLPRSVPVSVVIATLDRPDDLRTCLGSIRAQRLHRPVQVVVVDNNPASGLTPPVAAEFGDVLLVAERRRGLAYARNRGFAAADGEVLVATDDDVVLPDGWLEEIVAPFARADVGAVTGHVLPLELETVAQRSFEAYGGLGRGFRRFERDRTWFEACKPHPVPTWELGATANAAFRRSALLHPEVGLMDEALGPGTPTGVGEDTYLFYRLLKAGYTIAYEPRAYLWHRHRREVASLRRQLYAYSKGHVAYHLTTLLRDGDFRAVTQLLYTLPCWHYLKQLVRHVRGRATYPLELLFVQMAGSAAGPYALWRSRRRVRREGRSAPLAPARFPAGAESGALRGSGTDPGAEVSGPPARATESVAAP